MKMMTKTKRNLVLIFMCALLVAIAICPVSANQGKSGVTKATPAASASDYSFMQISADYQEVASSDTLSLVADLRADGTGNFAVKNLNNGYVWYSNPNTLAYDGIAGGSEEERFCQSQIIVGYVFAQDEVESARVNYFETENRTLDIQTIENGIKVVYTYQLENIVEKEVNGEIVLEEKEPTKAVIPVEYTLENDHFSAKVDIGNIQFSSDIIVTDINLLPYFGAGLWTEEGYLFVPDGSGALISFNGKASSESAVTQYEEFVYGDDMSIIDSDLTSLATETIRMPVFGIINGQDNALLGVIDEGAAAGSILASPSTKEKVYCTANAKANIRLTSFTKMFAGRGSNAEQEIFRLSENPTDFKSFKVDYYMLNGDNANYVGMANKYRQHLIDNEMLNKVDMKKPALNVDLYGAIDVKANVLGFTYRKLKALTTYEEATEIAKSLKAAGVDNLALRYKGWANNGITNKGIATKAKLIGLLGGSGDYKDFTEYAKKQGIEVFNDVELTTFTSGKSKYASKTAYAEVYNKYQYLRSVYAYDLNGYAKMMLNPKYIYGNAEKYINSFKKQSNNISISDLAQNVYSHLKRGELQYRTKYVTEAEKVLKLADKENLTIATEKANSYAFKYSDKIYMAPIYSSGYTMIDSEIPFYQIVLHGYIPMTGEAMVQSTDSQVTYLKCVESGIELLWSGIHEKSEELSDTIYDDLYGSQYTLWRDDAVEKYNEYYKNVLEKIYDKPIVNHKEVLPEVTLTEYENMKVYVNYNNEAVKVDGLKIEPMSFNYKEVK